MSQGKCKRQSFTTRRHQGTQNSCHFTAEQPWSNQVVQITWRYLLEIQAKFQPPRSALTSAPHDHTHSPVLLHMVPDLYHSGFIL